MTSPYINQKYLLVLYVPLFVFIAFYTTGQSETEKTEVEDDPSDSEVGMIAGAAVAAILCMIIVIIMVIIFLRR